MVKCRASFCNIYLYFDVDDHDNGDSDVDDSDGDVGDNDQDCDETAGVDFRELVFAMATCTCHLCCLDTSSCHLPECQEVELHRSKLLPSTLGFNSIYL